MGPIILDNIDLEIEPDGLLAGLGLDLSGEDRQELFRLVREAGDLGRPRAMYRAAYLEERGDDYVVAEGIRFKSRVLSKNLEQIHRIFPFVATCGTELERWADAFKDSLQRLLAGAVRGRGLVAAIQALDRHIAQHHHPGKISMMNPGSIADWPLDEQEPLFRLLGDTQGAIGVTLKPDLFMSPALTASGIKFPDESSFESCLLCPRENCPGRRAPHDPGLYDRKYRKG